MTDNRTTELLCKLLEERGVSCQTHYLHVSWRVGPKLYVAVDNLDGTLTIDNLTPEQAIAATLGVDVKDCENLLWEFIGALDVADATDADKKPIVSDCARRIAATLGGGTLTAEQVREAVLKRGNVMGPRFYGDWQAIADELNARAERTCRLIDCEREDGLNPDIGGKRCSNCGAVWYPENGVSGFRYCPNCRAEILREVR